MECHVCGRQLYLLNPTIHQEWCKYYRKGTKPSSKVVKKTDGAQLTIPYPQDWDL